MKWIGFAFFLLVGSITLAIAGEMWRKGRFWFSPKSHRSQREARWVRRSNEPIAFWIYTGFFGIIGIACVIGAIWAALS
jgi:uncharacterized membrane protein YfcA